LAQHEQHIAPMTDAQPDAGEPALRWRIPPASDEHALQVGFAMVLITGVIGALVMLVAAPAEMRDFGLAAIGLFSLLLAWRQWRRHQRVQTGPDNVWLDPAGVHWLDMAGQERSFARAEIVAYRIAVDPHTLRQIPALTLHLAGGHLSQPMELHEPATSDEVRAFLAEHWQLPEREAADKGPADYDRAIAVYSECHDELAEWHWEGNAAALGELFSLFTEVAELPLAPAGARPLGQIILASRRDPERIEIAHARHLRIEPDAIVAPAGVLGEFARRGAAALATADPSQDEQNLSFPWPLGPTPHSHIAAGQEPASRGSTWTVHLHLRG
jgi:hypothetical protein